MGNQFGLSRAIGQSYDRCRLRPSPFQHVAKTENRRANSRTTTIAREWPIVQWAKAISSCQTGIYMRGAHAVRIVVGQKTCRSIKLLADFAPMHDSSIILAAVDPAGPFAAVCGITWTLLCPTSGVAALVSAALCPFKRTAHQALRLSGVGLWAGSIAFVVATVATVATAGFPKDPPESVADAVILISLTAIAPVLAYFTGRLSRRKMIRLEAADVVG